MGWGTRPKVDNKLGIPTPQEGSDGDIQLRQTNLGAKLYGKLGGRWSSTFLSNEEEVIGTSGTKIGMDSSGALTVGSKISLAGATGIATITDLICSGRITVNSSTNSLGADNIIFGITALESPSNTASQCFENIAIGTDCMKDMTGGASGAA